MTTPAALTAEQRESFETLGYLRLPGALDDSTVHALRDKCLQMRDEDESQPRATGPADDWRARFAFPSNEWQAACDDARWQAHNVVARDDVFLDLIDHHKTLPIVAEILNENIFLVSSRAMIREGIPATAREFEAFRLDWHRDLGTSSIEMTEPHPRLSVKVAFWLSVLSARGQGAMQVVPGSHRHTGPLPIDPDTGHPFGALEIHAEPGDALLFDQRLWHAAAPNITAKPRICLFYGYGFRWLRPDDYRQAPDDLMERLSAPRRQLLGAAESPLGYYLPTTADLSLRQWLESLDDE